MFCLKIGDMPTDKPKDAGALEIEVTPEMIDAGLRELWESGAVEHPMSIDRDLVRRIFFAMQNVRDDQPCRKSISANPQQLRQP